MADSFLCSLSHCQSADKLWIVKDFWFPCEYFYAMCFAVNLDWSFKEGTKVESYLRRFCLEKSSTVDTAQQNLSIKVC